VKVALVHDWLTGMRGGERCLEAFLCIYPDADIFTLVHIPGTTSEQIDRRVKKTSFLNSIPNIRKFYKIFLPFYPLAAASFDLAGYDLVISLSHAAAKNVRVPKGVPHICYCFTPMRYIWDQAAAYLRGVKYVCALPLIQLLRWWDMRGATRVTHFVAISSFISARIRKFYGRSSAVIAPPVRMAEEHVERLTQEEQEFFDAHPESFFLCAGALVPYKKIDVAVRAFNELQEPLWIVGSGPESSYIREIAGSNVRVLGRVSEAFLWECYKRCRALIFPGIEDFGIVPVECLSSGRPVIGIDAGGLRESVIGWRQWQHSNLVPSEHTGVFIAKDRCGDSSAIVEAVTAFLEVEEEFSTETLKARARRFSYSNFFKAWASFLESVGLSERLSEDSLATGNAVGGVKDSSC
jgi:glycosyltransferase involved in cell wall biosynthesis